MNRTLSIGVVGVLVAALAGITAHSQQPSSTAARPPVTKTRVSEWMKSLSNWGRWGKDDQLGSLNLVTPAKRQQAMALAKSGVVVSLQQKIVLGERPPEVEADGKPSAQQYYRIRFRTFPKGHPRGVEDFSSDIQEFHVHGPGTHLDALCHYSDGQGHLYNGYSLTDTVSQTAGCTKLGLDTLKTGIVTRGVLVDMTRVKRSGREAGGPVYVEDIEAWEKQFGVKVSPGDALFVFNPRPVAAAPGPRGGIDLSALPWLKERGVALTSSVNTIPDDIHADHRLTLVALGLFLLDSPDLTQLAETAARLNRWEFLLVVAPNAVPGSTGAPVNPLALF
jgi:hypothetical protein